MNAAIVAAALGRHTPKSGGGFMTCCPAHDDRNPSLAIDEINGALLVKCFAGCDQGDVVAALKSRGLWPEPGNVLPPAPNRPAAPTWQSIQPVPTDAPPPPAAHSQHGKPSASWNYRNQAGDLLGIVYRFDGPDRKQVLPLSFCTNGSRRRWRWQALPEPRPLYGLDLLGNAAHVVVCEGEKATEAARRLLGDRLPVVTWPGGSNTVSKADWRPLAGKTIAVWPDSDEPGTKAALAVADACLAVGATSVKIAEPPADLAQGWDLADAEAEGWTGEQIRDYLKAALAVKDFRARHLPTKAEKKPTQTEIISKLRRGADIKALDIAVEWHVAPLLPKGAVILFFGRGGFGKSTLMIQLGGALAAGHGIFGMQATAAPVVYVDYENSLAILSKRLQDIPADDILFLDSTSEPPRLDKPERNLYIDILAAHPGAVFIFDTLRSAQSSDENDSRVMADVMCFLRLLRDRGATVIVLHHTPKSSDRKYKGSGAIFDMSDHILGLYPVKQAGDDAEVDDDEDEAKVFRFGTCMKARFEPSRMFLTFSVESRHFEIAPDPAERELADIAAIISSIGLDAKQGDIIAAAHNEGLSQKRALSLLSKGEDRLWSKRRGVNNSKLYSLTETGLAVLQPYIGAKNRKTEAGSISSPENPEAEYRQQSHSECGFGGFAGNICQTEKPDVVADLPAFDV